MWADQPAVRAQVNIGVNIEGGTSAKSRITAAQNSTLVARTRSGRRACSSSRAAFSRARALETGFLEAAAPLDPRRPEPLAGVAERARPRVLGPVDAMAKAHQP